MQTNARNSRRIRNSGPVSTSARWSQQIWTRLFTWILKIFKFEIYWKHCIPAFEAPSCFKSSELELESFKFLEAEWDRLPIVAPGTRKFDKFDKLGKFDKFDAAEATKRFFTDEDRLGMGRPVAEINASLLWLFLILLEVISADPMPDSNSITVDNSMLPASTIPLSVIVLNAEKWKWSILPGEEGGGMGEPEPKPESKFESGLYIWQYIYLNLYSNLIRI